jgi:transmembrane sensor
MSELRDPVEARIDAARQLLDPPWDEVRQRRVLTQTLEEKRRALLRGRVRRVSVGAGLGAVAVAAGVLLTFGDAFFGSFGAAPVEPGAPQLAANVSTVTFADGSRARLSPGALLGAAEQTETRVQVAQEAGAVRYEVRHDPAREFVVHARDVEVTVLGTVFSVELLEEAVEVRVVDGRVRVHDGERRVVLVRGEDLRVATPPRATPRPKEASQETEATPATGHPAAGTDPRTEAASPAPKMADVDELLARADRARRAGQLDVAARALGEIAANHSADPRATSALFTLGRVERARGRHGEAARAFRGCYRRSPAGSLAEDALAEEANSWALAGQSQAASSAAARYLQAYPAGTHAERMRQIRE